MAEKILNIEDLSIWYRTYRGYSHVVDHIHLHVDKGEKIGLVGESGCGKTTTMKTVMGVLGKDLIHIPNGTIDFRGKNVLTMKQSDLLDLRRSGVSMISQSPMSALNPVFTIGQQLMDILKYSGKYNPRVKEALKNAAHEALTSVMLSDPDRIMASYPHQLSGGLRQRVMIGMAMVCRPKVMIADEPTTAIDSITQYEILEEFVRIKKEHDTAMIFINHDLGEISKVADDLVVMNSGTIADRGSFSHILHHASDPYTRLLVEKRSAVMKKYRESIGHENGGAA